MSRENVEVVRQAFDAVGREDWVALAALIAEDCEVHDFDTPDAAGDVYRGPDGVLDWLAEWDRAWKTWEAADPDLREAPDGRIVALFRIVTRGRDSLIEMTRLDGAVYTLRNGKISRIEYYNDQREALEAAGLPE
jgi:ketosteroid isomerase-like protein